MRPDKKNPFSLLKTANRKFRLPSSSDFQRDRTCWAKPLLEVFGRSLSFSRGWNSSQSSTESLRECDGLRKSVSDVFLVAFCAIVAVVPPVVGGLLFFMFFRKGLIVCIGLFDLVARSHSSSCWL